MGKSGCGKSVTALSILRLIEPTDGKIHFEGQDVTALDKNAMRNLRREMQIIFQDPYASLNPRMTVGSIIGEPLEIHKIAKGTGKAERVASLLQTEALLSAVPIPDPTVTKKRIILEGDVPSPIESPSGCHFHTRCMYKEKVCEKEAPEFKHIGGGHWVACHFRPKA